MHALFNIFQGSTLNCLHKFLSVKQTHAVISVLFHTIKQNILSTAFKQRILAYHVNYLNFLKGPWLTGPNQNKRPYQICSEKILNFCFAFQIPI